MSGYKPAQPPAPGHRAAPVHHAPPPVRWPASVQPPVAQAKAAAPARTVVPPPPVRWPAGAPVQAKAATPGRAAPPPGPPPPAFASPAVVAQRKPVPNGPAVIQRMNDDDDDYIPPSEQKGDRHTFSAKQVESLIKKTAHEKKHKKAGYTTVYTCRACGRPLAYVPKKGKFTKTKLKYVSKVHKKPHEVSSAAMDHIKPWAKIHKKLKKLKKSDAEIKTAYFDEDNLRALCKKCNESHKYEGKDVLDYDSGVDGRFDPPTPKNEPENKGSFSMFWGK